MNAAASKTTATASPGRPAVDRYWWVLCVLLIFPAAAILHNAVFFYATCMLNPFGTFGNDYTSVPLLQVWLKRDPSLWAALLVAHIAYHAGLRYAGLRIVVPIFLVAFLPLTVWVWDIPFTDRVICYGWHDGRLKLGDYPLGSVHFYAFCGALFVALLIAYRKRISFHSTR